MALTKEQILGVNDVKIEEVEVPEWGGTVLVREMSSAARDSFDLMIHGKDGSLENTRAKLCALTICDEDGKLLFGVDEIEVLGQKSGRALDRVFKAVQNINRLLGDSVEEAEGN